MDGSELSYIFTENSRDSPELVQLEEQNTPLCWHCKKGTNRRNLICPCKCANSFVHSACLTLIANNQNKLVCQTCGTHYPLERQPKSILNMLRKASVLFFMILFSIIANFLIGIMTIIILSINNSTLLSISLKIINGIVFAFFVAMTIIEIMNWSKRIYELYHEWHRNTYEWILISQDDNIQNIDETAV